MATVMVVDDEERIRGLLARSLSTEGHSVVTAATARAALERLEGGGIDLVLLDLVMPGVGGLVLLKRLKESATMPPVIVLSGVTDVGARVQALDDGAVDVVAKPFSLSELLARVRRHVGRSTPAREEQLLVVGDVRLDLGRRRASFHDVSSSLTERESSLLAHLMRRRGTVCRKEELLRDVWRMPFDPGSNVVEVCVGRLRGKLGQDLPVETIRGVGYGFYED